MSNTKQHTILNAGCQLCFDIRGKGEPLLLLHGMTGTAADWSHAAAEQLATEFQLITPDARGHGRSSAFGDRLTHAALADDVLAMLEQLGLTRVRAIGMSLGGNTLLHLARKAPAVVDRMVLVSATPYFPEQARSIMRKSGSVPANELDRLATLHGGVERARALLHQCEAFAKDYSDMAFTPKALSQIRAETLVVYGDSDPLYPVELGVELARNIPRSALWVIPGGGHGPIFAQRAQLFAELALRFLKGGVEALAN